MNDVALLIASLDPQPIYASSATAARYVAATFAPTLLVIGVYLRTLETGFDALAGEGRWARALRDIALWGTVLALYFALGTLLSGFMNAVYRSMDRIGSLHLITDQLAQLASQAAAKPDNITGIDSLLDNLAANLVKAVMFLFYYATLLVLAFLAAFLKIANAIGYSVGFLWGLIAIPLSISGTLRLLRPWGHFFGTILLWPVVQALMLALFAPVFHHAAQALITDPAVSGADTSGAIYMLYSVLNLIVSAILVAAPFIAHALLASGTAASLVTPFTAAAVAAGAGLARRVERTSGASAFAPTSRTGSPPSVTVPRPRMADARPAKNAADGLAPNHPDPSPRKENVTPAGTTRKPRQSRTRKRNDHTGAAQT